MHNIMNLNYLPLIWFLFCWLGYHYFSKYQSVKTTSLTSVMHGYRERWANQIILRENHMEDVSSIGVLERTATFFASSSLIILAGMLAMIKSSDDAITVISNISVGGKMTLSQFELVLLSAVIIYAYAFFKMSWSIRLYSFVVGMIGALPSNLYAEHKGEQQALSEPIATTLSLAAYHFNTGLRSFYFSIALFAWFINPWAMVVSSLVVVIELYRREFRSTALKIMT